MAAPPGRSSQALGALLPIVRCLSCQCWPGSSLADLEPPGGMAEPGRVPRAPEGQPGPLGWDRAGGSHAGRAEGTEGRTVPVALASREACFFHHLLGPGRGARPPPARGVWGGLAATYLSCSSAWTCGGIYGEDRNRLNSSSQARPSSPCSPCVPGLGGSGGEALSRPDGGGREEPAFLNLFSSPHICSLPLPWGWSWVSVFIKRRK